MQQLLLFILLTMAALPATAQDFDRQLLDDYLDSLEHYDRAMGSLAITQGGEVVYARAIGHADSARTEPATPDHVYRVGSITKTFTAVVLHRLAEAGKLSLSNKLAEYYPQIPNADSITLDQMMRHRSGISNYTATEDFFTTIDQDRTPEELITVISDLTPDFAPGGGYNYSNSNYLLLGYIAESVSGRPMRELLRDYVFEPAGLANTYIGGPIDPARKEVISFSKTAAGWEPAGAWSMGNAGAAGNLSSTATDLNMFYTKLLEGELLPEAATKEMMALEDNYGQGLLSMPYGDLLAYGHTGGIEGFSTLSGYFPNEKVALTYLGNGSDVTTNEVALSALKIFFGDPFEIPDLHPVADLPESEMRPLEGTYATPDFPLDVKVFVEGGKLMAQATGQGAFPLTPDGPGAFVFTPAGIRLEFDEAAGTMRLIQGPVDVVMTK